LIFNFIQILPVASFSFNLNYLSGRIFLSLGILLLALAATTLVFGAFRVYAADFFYNQAFHQATGPAKTSLLQKAVKTNPFFAEYDVILARSLMNQAQKSLQGQQLEQAGQEIASAVAAGQRAVAVSPNWVAGWETLGLVYQKVQGLVEGAPEWAVKSFEKAIELEPTNPLLYSQLGQLYFGQNEMALAKKRFLQAELLKPDDLEPRFFLALIREKEGDASGAARALSHLQKFYPLNADLSTLVEKLKELEK